jgi:hypothetical protein
VSNRLPYPLPRDYDPSGPFRNPGVTNPLPAPGDIPTPCWFGGAAYIQWSVLNTPTVNLTADWSSPIFDMRPDIRGLTSNTVDNGTPGHVSGVPIWNPSAQLWLQFENPALGVNGISAQPMQGLQIIIWEEAHVCDPQNLSTVSNLEGTDITSEFDTTGASAMMGFYPIGDGNPVRYYRLRMTLNLLKNVRPGGNEFVVSGAGVRAPQFVIRPVMY